MNKYKINCKINKINYYKKKYLNKKIKLKKYKNNCKINKMHYYKKINLNNLIKLKKMKMINTN